MVSNYPYLTLICSPHDKIMMLCLCSWPGFCLNQTNYSNDIRGIFEWIEVLILFIDLFLVLMSATWVVPECQVFLMDCQTSTTWIEAEGSLEAWFDTTLSRLFLPHQPLHLLFHLQMLSYFFLERREQKVIREDIFGNWMQLWVTKKALICNKSHESFQLVSFMSDLVSGSQQSE